MRPRKRWLAGTNVVGSESVEAIEHIGLGAGSGENPGSAPGPLKAQMRYYGMFSYGVSTAYRAANRAERRRAVRTDPWLLSLTPAGVFGVFGVAPGASDDEFE